MLKRGFSLVEILVVIGVIALLAAILIPGITNSIRSGKKATCIDNMRQIGAALIAYRQDKGTFPDPAAGDLQAQLIAEKKLGEKKFCPMTPQVNADTYSVLYNYYGYAKELVPRPLKSIIEAEPVYKTSNDSSHYYWHQNGYPDTDFPGLANSNAPNSTIVTICANHTNMQGKYVILRKDGTVEFAKPVEPDADKFWMLSVVPK